MALELTKKEELKFYKYNINTLSQNLKKVEIQMRVKTQSKKFS